MQILVGLAVALIAGLVFGEAGFFFGALAGIGGAYLWTLQRDLRRLEQRVEALAGEPAPKAATSTLLDVVPRPPATDSSNAAPAAAEAAAPNAPAAAPGATSAADRVPPPRVWQPPPPTAFDLAVRRFAARALSFFTGGNPVVRIGVVVLFFGVAFLLRYAFERDLLPIELRLAGSAAGGIALAAIGWRLRQRRDTYGLVLQGAGVGLLYLTVFAAARLYDLVPLPAAFVMLVVLVAASSLLAVLQNAQALAIFSMAGGFLAPVLISTGAGSHVALFSYYALLNAGILVIAWYRAWRWLNWVGFVFTFAIGATWGYQYYRPEFFATTEPFLVLFFAYYLGVSVLFARHREVDLKGLVDGTLVFGTPIVAFALQAALVADMPFGLAYSALAAAAVYLALVFWLRRRGDFSNLLGRSFLALAIVFATLAIPFAFDNQRWTGAIWALEGAGLLWVGLRQRQLLPRVAGMLLQLAAAVAFLGDLLLSGHDDRLFFNSGFLGAVLIALAGGCSSYLLAGPNAAIHRLERALRWLFLLWATLWWYAAFLTEIDRYVPGWYGPLEPNNVNEHLGVLTAGLTTAALVLLAARLRWREVLAPGFLLLPALVVALFGLDAGWARKSPLADLGWLAWPVAFAALLWHLRRASAFARPLPFWHAGGWWFAALFLAWTAVALTHPLLPDTGWEAMLWGAVPLLVVVALLGVKGHARWPLSEQPESYLGWGMAVMFGALALWLCVSGIQAGNPAPLPYLVLLNPLELTQLGILLVAWWWTRRLGNTGMMTYQRGLRIAIGALAFGWLNLSAARAVHYYAGVPYPIERLAASDAFQATASILWTLTALALMGFGARRDHRPAWITGALLLAVVIFKLFTVDLSNLNTVARIVSFITVGVLMLLIGYLAPLPPAKRSAQPT
ncbi:MAG: DUF2339 domain-containing protein [Pseudomonadales bacterium]